MVYAALAAGGIGLRMGYEMPKQFICINNKPIIIHTIERFLSCRSVDFVYIGINNDWLDYTKQLLQEFFPNNNSICAVAGGEDRHSTVLNIIEYINEAKGITECDIIITHDAVRPFINEEIIKANIEAAKQYGACGTFISAVDTMAVSQNGECLSHIPDRNTIYHVQTPQSFNIKKLKECYSSLSRQELSLLTDICGVVMQTGTKVKMLKGLTQNIKITTPHDLELAKLIIVGEKNENR